MAALAALATTTGVVKTTDDKKNCLTQSLKKAAEGRSGMVVIPSVRGMKGGTSSSSSRGGGAA
eukprot:GSA120T00009753001.1